MPLTCRSPTGWQQQTGIPYALLDGRFDGIASAYRTLGELIGQRAAGEDLARFTDETMKTITGRAGAVPRERRPRVYYARGPRGLETGLGGSINVETIELLAQNVAGATRGGLATTSIEQVLLWNPEIITIDRTSPPMSAMTPPGRRSRPCATAACTCRPSCRSAGSIFHLA